MELSGSAARLLFMPRRGGRHDGNGVMLTSAECLTYAEECERIARDGPAQNTAVMLAIANAWRRCAEELERRENPAPQSTEGD